MTLNLISVKYDKLTVIYSNFTKEKGIEITYTRYL